METPVNYKDVDINGRSFRINKIEAKSGCYMLIKTMSILTPIVKAIKLDEIEDLKIEEISMGQILDKISIGEVFESLCSMKEEDFRYVQDNCLKAVEEILPAGPARVLDKYGNFGVLNIEFDMFLVMNLTVQSLMFNVSGFFGGSPLASIMKNSTLYQQVSKM